jgi:endonuclease/exonuclease/phosphatase family metal-dependent hydrolase
MQRILVLLCLATAVAGCTPVRPAALQLTATQPLTCAGSSAAPIRWVDLSAEDHREHLDSWCRSVGGPLVTLTPAHQSGDVRRLLILSWNIHVGSGQVQRLVEMLRDARDADRDDTGVVLLLQEAFRGGNDVPESFPRLLKVPGRIAPKRSTPAIGELAAALGMSVAYVPSMRNGPGVLPSEREDRGSAILSTEPLSDVTAIELPMLKQRRIVVMATVQPRGDDARPVRVMATHLDTLGPRGKQAKALAAYIATLPETPDIVMGGDLNSLWGMRDTTVSTLRTVMNMEACGTGATHLLGRFDYIFSTFGEGPRRHCETLNEKYSSDHRPLLLTIDWAARS